MMTMAMMACRGACSENESYRIHIATDGHHIAIMAAWENWGALRLRQDGRDVLLQPRLRRPRLGDVDCLGGAAHGLSRACFGILESWSSSRG